MSAPLCIYHGNCADGFGAAWAVRKALPDAEFHAGVYGNPPPDVRGRDLILVDFTYKLDVLREMASTARSVLVLDHHKSAADEFATAAALPRSMVAPNVFHMDQWAGVLSWKRHLLNVAIDESEGARAANIYALFDMQRSGAGMAWDFFHPGIARPRLIEHIEDRDLWRFALEHTREIQASVFSYPYDFTVWDELMSAPIYHRVRDGAPIERKYWRDLHGMLEVMPRQMAIGGHVVPVANLPHMYSSDAGAILAARGFPFAACYWDTPAFREFSLRSTAEGLDVSEIARMFGGGGHQHAAGFRVAHDHPLARGEGVVA